MARIADLNDEHRKKIPRENFAITGGVQRLGPAEVEEILEKVRKFDDFNEDNDPYREHDFWSFYQWDEKIFWKFDYYAKDSERLSDDPSDPEKTVRVLTIMLASEW